MFEPKYLIRLNKDVFPCDPVACLGSQLKTIVKGLGELMLPHIWFGSDVDAISHKPKKLGIDSFQLKKIGDDGALIGLCETVDQFLSGVFIAIGTKNQNCKCWTLSIETEDEPFRSINLEDILIEIRAFDTTCFEVYSDNPILIKNLSKMYGVKINKS